MTSIATGIGTAGSSLLPTSINSNLKKLKKSVGKSLLNLHSLLTSGPAPPTPLSPSQPFKPFQPKSTPRRPPRRSQTATLPRRNTGYQNFKDKGNLLDEDEGEKFLQTEVIDEVITPAATPVFERDQPAVKMPGAPSPSVPMPGQQPRIPPPTLTFNSLDLIGTP